MRTAQKARRPQAIRFTIRQAAWNNSARGTTNRGQAQQDGSVTDPNSGTSSAPWVTIRRKVRMRNETEQLNMAALMTPVLRHR